MGDYCYSALLGLRSSSVGARAATLLLLGLTLPLLLSLTVVRPLPAVASQRLPLVSLSSYTSARGLILFSYETQCISSAPESTTTTIAPDGSTPLPCDLLGAQAAQDHTFLAIVGLALIGFLLSVLVGLRLWT